MLKKPLSDPFDSPTKPEKRKVDYSLVITFTVALVVGSLTVISVVMYSQCIA